MVIVAFLLLLKVSTILFSVIVYCIANDVADDFYNNGAWYATRLRELVFSNYDVYSRIESWMLFHMSNFQKLHQWRCQHRYQQRLQWLVSGVNEYVFDWILIRCRHWILCGKMCSFELYMLSKEFKASLNDTTSSNAGYLSFFLGSKLKMSCEYHSISRVNWSKLSTITINLLIAYRYTCVL